MIFETVILVPTRVEIHADNRIIASEEAREIARRYPLIGEHCAKVLSVNVKPGQDPPPKRAA